jgi:two-component system response regulator AtoC
VLRVPDMLALYGPNEYEILLASTPPDVAQGMVSELDAALALAGAIVRTGLATYPRDGRTPEALVSAASRRVRGVEADRGATEPLVHDAVMERVHLLAERAAAGTINVLIVGETGVGKEVLAERVHRLSPRAEKAFLCLNCASLSEHLLESELFGHERGAFTGASEAKPGLLETAPGGTIFLDEIGELPLLLQAKLLRVLETRLVTRVGGLKPKAIDVRFVAATNRNLEEEVAAGRFRRDLYFRLNGMTLHIPPLRARRGEIAPLAAIFLRTYSEPFGRPAPVLSPEARLILEAYVWPGNVRELRNMMERAVLLCTEDEILPEHLLLESMSAAMAPTVGATPEPASERSSHARPTQPMSVANDGGTLGFGTASSDAARAAPLAGEDERERILRVLAECGGNQSRAAKALGIARSTLVLRLNDYQIPRPRK